MRVIAGKYKRTPLKTLEGMEVTRPTKDMVKEALFSSISIDGETTFLDLFAGSGAIGLEALSRGCKEAIFNDINADAVKIIKENLNKVHEQRTVYNKDYEACLNSLKDYGFDYIYADPPYKFNEHDHFFELINQDHVLNQNGILIFEVERKTQLKENYDSLVLFKEKQYGINKLLYYRYGEKL